MERIKKSDILTAVSIYSSRVSACIAALDESTPVIMGLGKSEGRLMGGKGVLDIDVLSKAIRNSLNMAQEEAGRGTSQAIVGISGASIKSEKSRGIVKLGHKGEEISNRNVREVLKVADTVPLNVEREIIHSIPQDFVVDGQNGIKNPVGLYGIKLEAETLLVTAPVPFLQNVIKSLNLAGVDAEDVAFSGIGACRCSLSPEDAAEKGVILIEIDNNFTALSFFFDNILRGVEVQQKSVISGGALEGLKEKADKVREDKPISKIILTGGAYFHEDFIEKVDSAFGVPSQTAYPRNIKGSAREMTNPSHLTSIGLACYGLERRREGMARKRGSIGLLHKATKRVNDFINEYF